MNMLAEDWNPIYRELAVLIGEEQTVLVFNEYRGTQVAFPMRLVSREAVKTHVKNNYPLRRVNQLAGDTGYSERNIRRILKEINNESR